MNEALRGVRDEAIELTMDALVTDIYTTSFMLAFRSLKAGGGSQEPGWLRAGSIATSSHGTWTIRALRSGWITRTT
ncbi:MAG: hypothetical protein GX131_18285 [candidate division WS1 bacterium]|nr:hypothetical protein [candidate division WS1 bacterium]